LWLLERSAVSAAEATSTLMNEPLGEGRFVFECIWAGKPPSLYIPHVVDLFHV